MKKFLALFDLHFGFENGRIGTSKVVRATHNISLINVVKKFAKDFSPDILILGGDQLNCGPVSHWHKGRPKLTEGFRLKEELDLLDKHILTPFDKIERKIWIDGNHERFIQDYLEENPALEGLIEPAEYLKLEKRGWECHEVGAIIKLGKLYFTHGDVILGKGSYVNPAQHLLNQTRVNIRCGHLHTLYAATDFNPIRGNDYHTAIVVPCMCATNCFYMKNKPSRILNGFLYGYIYPNGNFNDYIVITNNNSFVVNGVSYSL
jgi:hypothetical protein